MSKIAGFLREKQISFQYWEEDDCGSIEFEYRGLRYHVWEYPVPERGAQSNVRSLDRSEEYDDNYEETIINIMKGW